jgi:SAM-dependent methyltransferase
MGPTSRNQEIAGIHIQQRVLAYPDERIVVYLSNNHSDRHTNTGKIALDIGCGSGRHLRLLRDYGFSCIGIDYSNDAIAAAQATLSSEDGAPVELHACDLAAAPLADTSIDLAVFWGAAFLKPVPGMLADLRRVADWLRPGGRMICNFRTKKNSFYGLGESLDSDRTFLLDDRAGSRAGMQYTFLDEVEATALLNRAGFSISECEAMELRQPRREEFHSWLIFWAYKC